ncbi:MAG: uncharacterized protein QG595_609 [Pseudomonadota bacterium]|nr:uncharacterized protein [Pseudomonadota bacterium]
MNDAQRRFGMPHPVIAANVLPVMNTAIQEFIRTAPFAVMATSNKDGDCDASPRGGKPGFVKVLDEKNLLIPDICGNKLFNSSANLESNPKLGLIFMIPGCQLTVRVNGRVRIVDREQLLREGIAAEVFVEDDHSGALQGLHVEVDQAFAHCPRAFRFARLWDTQIIAGNAEHRSERYWYQLLTKVMVVPK